ncbi:MAG: TIGR00341 family protein [Planctomycetes bacterium]|nr:TIGR00341 family protein [Planctomycetota bacterium]MCP4771807.1 TIGR00341 family protein [Planctomycetota bacterium]MCP4860948.1 TIGR00341 family protein [Planctomycetota bacterium]
MATRLVQTFVPDVAVEKVESIIEELQDESIVAFKNNLPGPLTQFHILVEAEKLESVLDPMQAALGSYENFRAIVLAVQTVVPKLPEPVIEEEEGDGEAGAGGNGKGKAGENGEPSNGKKAKKSNRISREELLDDLAKVTHPNSVHWWMVGLSTIVATIGLATSNTAVLIGAMVIAPLLGPNMALALASTLGDLSLAKSAIKANIFGVALAFLVASIAGWLFDLNLQSPEILARTDLHLEDLLLALAAGGAGALAFTSGVPASLVGVMVAVALLPPLAVCALMATSGNWEAARGAGMLLLGNLVCVNLAGIVTFLLSGVAPRTWWQKRKTRKIAYGMLTVWALLLAALIFFVMLAESGKPGL